MLYETDPGGTRLSLSLSLPLYKSHCSAYPVFASQRTNALKPHLSGFHQKYIRLKIVIFQRNLCSFLSFTRSDCSARPDATKIVIFQCNLCSFLSFTRSDRSARPDATKIVIFQRNLCSFLSFTRSDRSARPGATKIVIFQCNLCSFLSFTRSDRSAVRPTDAFKK